MTTDNPTIKDQTQNMSRTKPRRASLMTLAATLLLTLLAPQIATAGTETVYTCRNADGSPGSDADWKYFSYDDPSTTGSVGHTRACGSGRPLESFLIGANFATTEYSSLHFEVPPDLAVTRIVRLDRETHGLGRSAPFADRIWYVGNKVSSGGYVLDQCIPAPPEEPGACGPTFNLARSIRTNFVDFGQPDPGWAMTIACTPTAGNTYCTAASATQPAVLLHSAVFQVADNTDPVIGQVSGTMAVDGTLSGSAELAVNATDSGSGVYQAVLKDGDRVVDTQIVDRNGGDCADNAPGNEDPYEFGRAVPCRTSVSRTLTFDTTKLSEGPITLRVALRDATGNEALAVNRKVTIDNIPAPRNTAPPTVGGTPQAGRSLVAGLGSWDLSGRDAQYTYGWLRCDAAGDGCTAIAGDGPGHDLEAADVGRRLVVEVTAQTDQGSTSRRSAPSGIVAAAPGSDPAPAVAPGDVPGPSSAPGEAPVPSATLATTLAPVVATLTRGPVNGAGASDAARLTAAFSGSKASRLTRNWGRRTLVRGTLRRSDGMPIRGALVEVASVNATPGAREVDGGAVRTGADGRWTATISGELASRTLSFRYRSHINDAKPAATATLGLRTRAGVTLAAGPRTTGPHGLIRFKGRLRSGPIPDRGKLVELQARGKGGGRWLTFRTLRSTRKGTFSAGYRLRRTVGSVTYVFRARARAETAYPFLTGTSKVVAVKVR